MAYRSESFASRESMVVEGVGMTKIMMKKNQFISKAYSHTLERETLVSFIGACNWLHNIST